MLVSKTLPWICRLRVGIVIGAAICIFGTIATTPAIRIFRAIRIPPAAALARFCVALICTVQRRLV